jgi:hypothetical protein
VGEVLPTLYEMVSDGLIEGAKPEDHSQVGARPGGSQLPQVSRQVYCFGALDGNGR